VEGWLQVKGSKNEDRMPKWIWWLKQLKVLNWKWNNLVVNFVTLVEDIKGSKMLWVSLCIKGVKSVDGGAIGQKSSVIKSVEWCLKERTRWC